MSDVTQDFYNEHASAFEKNTKGITPRGRDQFMSRLPEGGLVLDLGCAFGRDAKVYLENGFSVLGVDFSEKLIERAKELYPRARFVCADVRTYTYGEGIYDGIAANALFVHLPKSDTNLVLQKIYRGLKPFGHAYINFKIGEGEGLVEDERYDNAQKYYTYFSKKEFEGLVKENGFKIVAQGERKPTAGYENFESAYMVVQKQQ